MPVGADIVFLTVHLDRITGNFPLISCFCVYEIDIYLPIINHQVVVGGIGLSP